MLDCAADNPFAPEIQKDKDVVPVEQPCKVLVVDDDESVHHITKLILERSVFPGWKLDLLHATSGVEAKEVFARHRDIAVVILDVIMEHDEAGLDVARYIREELQNRFVRIIIRTGQAGIRPDGRLLATHDINDFRTKSELTSDKLYSCVLTAIRNHAEILSLQNTNATMQAALACLGRMHGFSQTEGGSGVLEDAHAEFLRHLFAHEQPPVCHCTPKTPPVAVAWFGHWERGRGDGASVVQSIHAHLDAFGDPAPTLPASHRECLAHVSTGSGWHRDAYGVTGWMRSPGADRMTLFHATSAEFLAPDREAWVMIALSALARTLPS